MRKRRAEKKPDLVKAMLADRVEAFARILKETSGDVAKWSYYSEALLQMFNVVRALHSVSDLHDFVISVLGEMFAAKEVVLLRYEAGALHCDKWVGLSAGALEGCSIELGSGAYAAICRQGKLFEIAADADPALSALIEQVSGRAGFRPLYLVIFTSESGLEYAAFVGGLRGKSGLDEGARKMLGIFIDYVQAMRGNLGLLNSLTEEKNKLAVAFENVGDALIYTDTELNIIVMNARATEMLRAVGEFKRGDNLTGMFKAFTSSVRFEEVLIREGDLVFDLALAGEGLYYSVFSTKVKDEFGDTNGMMFVIKDESDKRHAESMKAIFMSTVSHKLRTPLTIIRESIGLLHEGIAGELSDKQKKIVDITHSQAQYLSTLIASLLDFTRIQADIMASVLKKDRHALDAFFADVIRSMMPVFDRRKVRVSFSQQAPGLSVYFDRDKMQTAIGNILDNAAKFNPAGTEVEIRAGLTAGMAEIIISDNGVGITKHYLSHLFESFSQLDEDFTGQIKGMGLGLYMAREIIRAHGGEITCESELGRGTTFVITMPVI